MIRAAILRWAQSRTPDFVIGGEDRPYLRRHWLLPRNRFFNVYVHEFLRSDDDRALHDHPWLFNASWMLSGTYREWTPCSCVQCVIDGGVAATDRKKGAIAFRWGSAPHRIELTHGPCWTVFITGPRVREWGFHCPAGWVHWKRFTAPADKGAIGRGCD